VRGIIAKSLFNAFIVKYLPDEYQYMNKELVLLLKASVEGYLE
jgi:predicted protein tyrosine phosphatase